MSEKQVNKLAENGFIRGQEIVSKIMGDYDSLNEQKKDFQAKEFMNQAVRDCTQITINFKN